MRRLATAAALLMTASAAWSLDIQSAGANNYSINGMSGFRKKSTDHYEIYYQRRPPASSFLSSFEKTWAESATLLPNLNLMHKSGDLQAQMGRDEKGLLDRRKHTVTPSPDGKPRTPFKNTVVFVDDRRDYERLAFSLHSPDEPEHRLVQAQETLAVVASYTVDGSVRVFWSQNPNLKILNSAAVHLSHASAADLIELHQKPGACPFWLEAGFGYTMEFKLFKKSATLYLDYESYYDEYYKNNRQAGGNIRETETFKLGAPWAPVIKRLMRKKDQDVRITTVLASSTANLNPERCGYIYAFVAFLTSSPPHRESFNNLMLHLQDNGQSEAATLLPKLYGYKDLADMEAAWHKWMLSSEFR